MARIWPFTNFHELNADWLLRQVKEAAASVAESLGLVQTSAQAAQASAEGAQTAAQAAQAAQTAAQAAQAAAENVEQVGYTAQLMSEYRCLVYIGSGTFPQTAGATLSLGTFSGQDSSHLVDYTGLLANVGEVNAGTVNGLVIDQHSGYLGIIKIRRQGLTQTFESYIDGLGVQMLGSAEGAVRYDIAQSLTTYQQFQARVNMNAPSVGALATQAGRIDNLENSMVSFTVHQNLTAAQQLQARTNIDAEEKYLEIWISPDDAGTGWESTATFAEIQAAYEQSKPILVHLDIPGTIDSRVYATINETSAGSAESMNAWFFMPEQPGSLIGSSWYRVTQAASALYVNQYSTKLVPSPTSNDEGNVLQAVQGRPAWIPSKTAIIHASLNTNTKVITPGDGFTFSNIQALVNDNRLVVLRVVTQNNYVFYFPLAVIRGTICYFYGTSLYPASTGYTKYNMYISLNSTNVASYLVTSESYIPE